MREVVGAGTHQTAAAMVKAADALWDAQIGRDPKVAAALTQRSSSPAPNSGKRGDKRTGNARSKSCLPFCPDFYSFQNPGNGVCKFHNYYAHKAHRCLVGKLTCRTTFGSATNPTHVTATVMHSLQTLD
jgi:hypothetical protein